MNTRTARRLRRLAEFHKSEARMERFNGSYRDRNPLRPISRIHGGWQWGSEIQGYGSVEGYCRDHKPHKTKGQAAACGSRFLRGIPSWQVWR